MIIHHLKASGFRVMGEPIEIKLPEEGRIGILGLNESGKTTLFQAIECALYGLKKGSGPEADRENLVTWGKNEAKLEIEFTSGQNRYNLQRKIDPKNLHRATLTPIIKGSRDPTSAITGLKDIEQKIEQITGMDRDSFTKLVYIKQKDLDALKELAKSKREQLVNKVMGIEIFDDASDKVKKDTSQNVEELHKIELQLDMVRKNKEDYENKTAQKSTLQNRIEEQKTELEAKKTELENTKALLAKYEWISNFKSAMDLECSLKGQLDQVEKELQKMSQLEKQAVKMKKAIDTYKPEVTLLQGQIQKLADVERRLKEAKTSQETLQTKKQETISRLGLPEKDLELLSQNLPAQKKKNLNLTGATLISGLACLVIAFLTTIFLLGGAAILLALSAYFFIQYQKIDKLVTKNIEIEATNMQLRDQEQKVSEIQNEKLNVTSESDYETSQEAQNRLNRILSQIETETGQDSIEGVSAILKSTTTELSNLTQTNPQNRKTTLENQIQTKQTEIKELQKRKPASTDEISYDKEKHEKIKNKCEKNQSEYSSIKEDIDYNKGTLKQLEKELEKLKPDFEQFPQLEKDVQAQKEKIQIQKLVNTHLSETSKELRNKVLPHARMVINQILPTLTSDRYSDFEITEDLKFKVHSNEAGGFKEREIFSGGTQDQFLIALRLAFTQSILDSRVMADRYSLLMDECTSSSDELRKQGIFEVLDAMKKTFSQIFIIAHEDIANYVDHNIVLERNTHGYTEIKSKSWA